MKKGMKESYIEAVALHDGPVHAFVFPHGPHHEQLVEVAEDRGLTP